MENKAKNFYSELPSWGKGVVAVGGVALVLYIVYNAYRKVKGASDVRQAGQVADAAKREVLALQSRGIKPSYSATQYESFALKLAEAMNGCGTTYESVTQVFDAMKNKADLLYLISSFGVRFYQPCLATSPISYARYLIDDKLFGGNLQTWMEYDLSSGEIKKINQLLAEKNIDFKF